jgi:hypothetical protein
VKFHEKGFWSITVYGDDKFLVPNDEYKYVIHSTKALNIPQNGAMEILLSRKKPEKTDNWLPLPQQDENFSLAYRCYKATEGMKKHPLETDMPKIIRI